MNVNQPLSILGISGSLRRQSYNTGALRAAAELMPEGATLDIFDLGDIPVYNQDADQDMPASVVEFKRRIREADALIFATPEYNYSVPGILKNAIDWASRPYGDNSFEKKPAAVMGASISSFGTARAQYDLRKVLTCLDVYTINKPEVLIANAQERFDEQGKLTDETTRKFIRDMNETLVAWTRFLAQRGTGGKS